MKSKKKSVAASRQSARSMYLCSWASGLLEILPGVPSGAISIASGTREELTEAIAGLARMSYPGDGAEEPLIPGVPENQSNSKAAQDAMLDFSKRVTARLKQIQASKKLQAPSWTGVSFRAMLTPDGEPYLESLVYRQYPGYKFQGNGTLTHPLRIVPIISKPVSNKGLTLSHPDDHALAGKALDLLHKILKSTLKPDQEKALTSAYGTLCAIHVAPRLQGERVCVHCGCTDSAACPGGCSWAITHKATPTGVCSQCVPTEVKLADAL